MGKRLRNEIVTLQKSHTYLIDEYRSRVQAIDGSVTLNSTSTWFIESIERALQGLYEQCYDMIQASSLHIADAKEQQNEVLDIITDRQHDEGKIW